MRLGIGLSIALVATLFVGVVAIVVVASTADRDVAEVGGRRIHLTASEQRGRAAFGRTCGLCHTLAASSTTARVGPDLDVIQPPVSQVRRIIASGAQGPNAQMGPQQSVGVEADDIAAYVARVADRDACCGPRG